MNTSPSRFLSKIRKILDGSRGARLTVHQFLRNGEVGFLQVERSARVRGVARHPGEGMLGMMLRLGARVPEKK